MAPVIMHIYDVGTDPTVGMLNEYLTAVGTGAFHGGVEVYGTEYSYGYCQQGTGIFSNPPKGCKLHHYRESITMPDTILTEAQVKNVVAAMEKSWVGVDYDLLRHNCVLFSNAFCKELGCGEIPAWIRNLAGAGASLQDGAMQAASAAQQAAIMARAKAGEIDAQYDISGKTQAKVQDLVERARDMDQQYAIRDTAKAGAKQFYFKATEMDEKYRGHIRDAGGQIIGEIKGMNIEQGPEFIRLLSFLTSVAAFVYIIYRMIFPAELLNPTLYILKAYIALFALTTVLFEAKPEWIQKLGPLSSYQDLLMNHCGFLNIMGGRGLFYIFQGTLWLALTSIKLDEYVHIAVVVALVLVGLLHIAAHFGIMPKELAQKAVYQARMMGRHAETMSGQDLNRDGAIG